MRALAPGTRHQAYRHTALGINNTRPQNGMLKRFHQCQIDYRFMFSFLFLWWEHKKISYIEWGIRMMLQLRLESFPSETRHIPLNEWMNEWQSSHEIRMWFCALWNHIKSLLPYHIWSAWMKLPFVLCMKGNSEKRFAMMARKSDDDGKHKICTLMMIFCEMNVTSSL